MTEHVDAAARGEGPRVEEGQVVAQLVPVDLKLKVEQAQAAVDRLKASLAENANVDVEQTAHKQAGFFLDSMLETVKAALARVDSGEARKRYAKSNLERVEQLHRSKTRTAEDLDQAELRYVESDVDFKQDQFVYAATVAIKEATRLMPEMVTQYISRKELAGDVLSQQKLEAEARLREVLQEQERGTMRSPVKGVVLERFVSNERFLSAGTSLLEIGRLEDIEIEADVLSLDVVEVEVGDEVTIYGPAVGRPTAKGKVVKIYPAGFTKVSSLGVEQQRVKVIIKIDAQDHQRLLEERHLEVGYRVRVKIATAENPEALVVPRSAIFRAADGNWQLYVVRGGRAVLQTVTVGLINDDKVEITKGLTAGERVVKAPESSLADGARVKDRSLE